ncbi:MAG: hypothetical protein HY820_43770 [Acidobacteria bacterium]|nr:hypothetical protein [Acidobacteriota bacterium]
MGDHTNIRSLGMTAVTMSWLLSGTLLARVTAPVAITIAVEEEVRVGKEMTVHVVLEPLRDLSQGYFQITHAEPDWKLLAGRTTWIGDLKAGALIKLRLTYMPLVENPEPIRGKLEVLGWPAVEGKMAPRQETPGTAKPDESGSTPGKRPLPEWEAAWPVPSPEAAMETRRPGDYSTPRQSDYAAISKERRAGYVATVTGSFVYRDEQGRPFGVRNATVELRDRDGDTSKLCGVGMTDADGNFSLRGECADVMWSLVSPPDYFVRLILSNNVVAVKPDGIFDGPYTFDSGVTENWGGGTLDLRELRVNNAAACQIHNLVVRAWQFLAARNENLPKVEVRWPATETSYAAGLAPLTPIIRVEPARQWDEFAVLHEYGHHLLYNRAESPAPDYNNGNCDPGHCIWWPELGSISWTEGFPNFFGAYLITLFDHDPGSFETHAENAPGWEDRIEGHIAAILWDLWDSVPDDQHFDGAGRRDSAFVLSFEQIWDIVLRYDPSSANDHNHPTTIHEFYDGLKALYPSAVNLAAEIFREHHILKPQPDLALNGIGALPATVDAGSSFPVSIAVKNAGNEVAVSSATMQLALVGSHSPVVLSQTLSTPAFFAAGAINNWNASVNVPPGTRPDSYRLRVCVDVPAQVPESDEGNNCSTSTASFIVPAAYPVVVQTMNGNYLTAVGGGGRLSDVLHSDARSVGAWERFTLVQQADNRCALKTVNGNYLTFVGGGGRLTDVVHSDATGVGTWEKFTLIPLGGSQYALATATGNYLTVVGGGGQVTDVVHTDARAIGAWEKLTLAGTPVGVCQR